MALVTVQRSPTPSTTSSPCASEADSGEEECRSQPRRLYLTRADLDNPHKEKTWNIYRPDFAVDIFFEEVFQ